MPNAEEWARLKKGLANYGLAVEADLLERRDRALDDRVIAAITNVDKSVSREALLRGAGVIDVDINDIVHKLERRFCGVPDKGGNIGPLTFGSPGGRWKRGVLSVNINTAGCQGISSATADNTIRAAFGQWDAISPFFAFSFVSGPADIRVRFGSTELDNRFGKTGGVLASASYPEAGNLSFDNIEIWTENGLRSTALHEIGHVLGLSHSNAPGGTMYPYDNVAVNIDAESVNAIQAMYGWSPQAQLPDRGTSHRAMLGITRYSSFTTSFETAHMVWKGVQGDSGIYHSELGAGGWSPQERVPGVGCSFSPALTEVPRPGATPGSGLLMAWKGAGTDSGIYWTRNLGSGWEAQRRVGGVGTSAAPALANVNGRVVMAWKGVGTDKGIYWSTFDGVGNWAPQQNVLGIGTSDSPALVAYQGILYMFWKGIPGDSTAYWSTIDFVNDPIWRPQRRVEYYDYETGGGIALAIGTTGPLSATVRGNSILLAWKGVSGDSTIWFSLFRNGEFSGQVQLPDRGTSVGPSVAQVGGQTLMAWKGVDGDSTIWWSAL